MNVIVGAFVGMMMALCFATCSKQNSVIIGPRQYDDTDTVIVYKEIPLGCTLNCPDIKPPTKRVVQLGQIQSQE